MHIWTLSKIPSYVTLLTGTFFMEQKIGGCKPSLSIFPSTNSFIVEISLMIRTGPSLLLTCLSLYSLETKWFVLATGRQGIHVLWCFNVILTIFGGD